MTTDKHNANELIAKPAIAKPLPRLLRFAEIHSATIDKTKLTKLAGRHPAILIIQMKRKPKSSIVKFQIVKTTFMNNTTIETPNIIMDIMLHVRLGV